MGTRSWVSPEIIQKKPYSKEVDIWSYGVFAFELATGLPPYLHMKGAGSLFDKVLHDPVPPIPNKWSRTF